MSSITIVVKSRHSNRTQIYDFALKFPSKETLFRNIVNFRHNESPCHQRQYLMQYPLLCP